MPLLTSVAVYEVRQSSKTKDCSAPAVTKQIMAACYDLPSVTLLPSSVVPFLFFFLFQKTGTTISENWDKSFSKLYPYPRKLGQNVPLFQFFFFRKTGTKIWENRDVNSQNVGRMFRKTGTESIFCHLFDTTSSSFSGAAYAAPPGYPCLEAYAFEKRGIPFIQRSFFIFS